MAARFDIWVCQGRVCTAAGANDIAETAKNVAVALDSVAHTADRVRVLRGGCYGMCELGPNVVVRRHEGTLPDVRVDRLSLTGGAHEHVYCGMGPELIDPVMRAHVERDVDVPAYGRAARERALPAKSPVAERIRQLRSAKSKSETP